MKESADSIIPVFPLTPSDGLLVLISFLRPVGGLVNKGGMEAHLGNGGEIFPRGSGKKGIRMCIISAN